MLLPDTPAQRHHALHISARHGAQAPITRMDMHFAHSSTGMNRVGGRAGRCRCFVSATVGRQGHGEFHSRNAGPRHIARSKSRTEDRLRSSPPD